MPPSNAAYLSDIRSTATSCKRNAPGQHPRASQTTSADMAVMHARGTVPCSGKGASWYRGTSLIRSNPLVGPYSRPMPRVLWWSYGGECFL